MNIIRFFRSIITISFSVSSFFIIGILPVYASDFEWKIEEEGKAFWYEYGIRQGTYSDPQGVLGDDGVNRGREIYDSDSDAWYWLDSVYNGAKAVNKEVWMPYIYQNEDKWDENEISKNIVNSGDMAEQVREAIYNHGNRESGKWGKWVRYDGNGAMVKGWYKVQGEDEAIYPDQAGNIYYYDQMTGLMAKGYITIDGVIYHFDEKTGVLDSENIPDVFRNNTSNNGSDNNGYSGNNAIVNSDLSNCKIGDIVYLGAYEQDNNIENGSEAIQWKVINISGDKALLLSEKTLDYMEYHNVGEYNVTWETCSLRKWLNSDFYNSAFDGSVQSIIIETELVNESNQKSMYGAGSGGNNTWDKVFCLSQSDIKNYFSYNDWKNGSMYGYCENLIAQATEYAASKGASNLIISENDYTTSLKSKKYDVSCIGKAGCIWWLRSPGNIQYRACYVDQYGKAGETICDYATSLMAVRPAMWVRIR